MKNNNTHIGRIVTLPGSDSFGFCFISLASTAKVDGSPHGLDTTADIFLHKDDANEPLAVGKLFSFEVVQDPTRGDGYYRALGAVEEIEAKLLPVGEVPMPGFNALAPFGNGLKTKLEIAPTTVQLSRAQPVDGETLKLVMINAPAASVPRDSSIPQNLDVMMQAFLAHLFPGLTQFGTHFQLGVEEEELKKQMVQARADHAELGMNDQLAVLEEEYARFVSFRKVLDLMVQQNIVRRDTIIPMDYLAEFFTAVPVWFFWTSKEAAISAVNSLQTPDPAIPEAVKYFCDLFPGQNWSDVFQIYNRRIRPLSTYRGDIIPPSVSQRIREMSVHFDYVVIMTPYHDVVGCDWDDPQWIRSVDPYVVGFKKGIPYFFILARFSDSGTFPLFAELVAGTTEFLRTNKVKLRGLNNIDSPYWRTVDAKGKRQGYFSDLDNGLRRAELLGNHLIKTIEEGLEAFELGQLFDWLRGKPLVKPAEQPELPQ